MESREKELEHLMLILKEHPKGLTIAEIAKLLHLNRISTSKYLNILLASGMAEMRVHGPSKVFYPSQRIPISSILNFSSSLLLVMNDNLSIIDANNALLHLFSLERRDLIGHRVEYSPLGKYINADLLYSFQKALDSAEKRVEVNWNIGGDERYLTMKITPTVLEDGSPGVTLIADDVTELTRYRLNLEQLVEERSRALQKINEQLKKEVRNHKKARGNLQKSEQQYRDLVEHASSLIIQLDMKGKIRFFNEYAGQFLGYSPDELLGKNLFETCMPESESIGVCSGDLFFAHLSHPDGHLSRVYEIIKKDNSSAWVSWTTKLIRDSRGKATGLLAIGQDITDLKRAEEALIESEQRYRMLYQHNPSMYFTLDSSATILSANTFGAVQLGYLVKELEGQSALCLVHPEDHHTFLDQLQVSLQNPGDIFHGVLRKVTKSGDLLWVKEDICTISYPDKTVQVFIVCHDITDQKRTEEKLTAIIEFLPDATFVINTKGVVIAWNQAIERLTGVKAENILGLGDYEYSLALYNVKQPILIDYALKPEEKIPPNYFNCRREGDEFFAETFNTHLNPEGVYLWGKASPLYDSSGNLLGAIESFRNITSMKRRMMQTPGE